ncbi:general substrate transporter [Podospora appendiculata]|uniref:General substrate transporter n=1 Tax=Podospora appendiculata TaxID=314037 RepID=A0AAE0X570_9PEZI|nr:general substrate transporter [Podospora appendiculata]
MRRSGIFAEKRVVFICFVIALGQFQNGYDSAAIAGFQSMDGFLAVFGYHDAALGEYNISTDVQRLIQSLISVGGFVSAVAIYALGSRLSRRVGLWIGCLLAVVSVSLMIGVTSLGGLYAGRLLLGASNGFLVPYSVMYMTESAPSLLRGSIVGMSTFQTSLGALFGILVDNYTAKRPGHSSWQIPLAVMYCVPVLLGTFIAFLPDTPRYYVTRGEDEKAVQAIRRLRGITDEGLLRAEVADIRSAFLLETELHAGVHLRDMFSSRPDRRRTLLCYACNVGQTATGVNFMAGFSVYLFVQARVGDPFMWVLVSLAIALTGNMLAFPAMRFIGRRELLVGCSLVSAVMMLGMAVVYTVAGKSSAAAGKALVALSIVYTWVYGVGQGPVLWALSTEIPSQRLRSQTVGTASGVGYIVGWLSAFFTPYFINPDKLNWGPKYGYIWGASNLVLAIWAFLFVPETKGRSLEQLDELFEKGVGARKFASFAVERQLVDGDSRTLQQSRGGGGGGGGLEERDGSSKMATTVDQLEDPEKGAAGTPASSSSTSHK